MILITDRKPEKNGGLAPVHVDYWEVAGESGCGYILERETASGVNMPPGMWYCVGIIGIAGWRSLDQQEDGTAKKETADR